MIPYYIGTPHIGADSFWLYTYAFQWGRQILQKAWLCWIVQGANSPARMPQICTKVDQLWAASAAKAYSGGQSMSVSVNQSFFPLTFNCLHWLMCFLSKALECNQEVALSPAPLCKHLCKGELAYCQERVSMHDFYVCVWNMCWNQQWKGWDLSVPV